MENNNDVQSVFEGLTRDEVAQLRQELIPLLKELRRVITGEEERQPVRDGTLEEVEEVLNQMTDNLNDLASHKKTLTNAKTRHLELSRKIIRIFEIEALGLALEKELGQK